MATVACTQARPPVDASQLANVERWWIVIGSSPMLDAIDWHHYASNAQMVVLSGDPRIPIDELPRATIRLAYVSVGEADPRRPYWPEVRDQPFLVEPNPEWPDNVRVDIRSTRWQELLMCEEIARLMQRGFDGLMLDTIDTVTVITGRAEFLDPASVRVTAGDDVLTLTADTIVINTGAGARAAGEDPGEGDRRHRRDAARQDRGGDPRADEVRRPPRDRPRARRGVAQRRLAGADQHGRAGDASRRDSA